MLVQRFDEDMLALAHALRAEELRIVLGRKTPELINASPVFLDVIAERLGAQLARKPKLRDRTNIFDLIVAQFVAHGREIVGDLVVEILVRIEVRITLTVVRAGCRVHVVLAVEPDAASGIDGSDLHGDLVAVRVQNLGHHVDVGGRRR